eukprot:scaffold85010_cov36-Phaeocystis_antarctica.AAC.1
MRRARPVLEQAAPGTAAATASEWAAASRVSGDSTPSARGHEQTTVRKPDHCAAGAGSTGQSKQRAGSGAGWSRALSRRPPRRSRCSHGCRQQAPSCWEK